MDVLDLLGRPIYNKKWVFIIGCYNSGTTLLEQVLSMHPATSSLQEEGVVLTDTLLRPEDFQWRRMWQACEEQLKVSEVEAARLARRLQRHWSHFYDLKKPVLLEKSIANTLRMSFFNRHFEEVYFIHLVRNGYAVAEGIHRKAAIMEGNPRYSPQERYPLELCARQWARSLEVVAEEKNRVEHFLELSYEDFTENPDEALRQITSFIGVAPFQNSFQNKMFSVHGVQSSIRNMNGKSLRSLSPADIAEINKAAHPYLQQCGYLQMP
jgi:hypothetical protein